MRDGCRRRTGKRHGNVFLHHPLDHNRPLGRSGVVVAQGECDTNCNQLDEGNNDENPAGCVEGAESNLGSRCRDRHGDGTVASELTGVNVAVFAPGIL